QGEEDPELNAAQQELVTLNGLRTINGLKSVNGLMTVNGLTTRNGLKSVNGLKSINGLRTLNGLKSVNGLDVDCTGKVAGVSCTGEPDGMLSDGTGLMSTAEGVTTASYLVRCALAGTDSIRIKDYTGALVTLKGEAGLAPEWKDGQCEGACQEKISACLMALTNGDGAHVDVELVAPFTLGKTHSYPYQEAAFYGNVFVDPPQAFYCVGKDYAQNGIHITLLEERSCTGYNEKDGKCPYVRAGYCNNAISLSLSDNTLSGDEKCSWTGQSVLSKDVAATCKDSSGGIGGSLSLLSKGKTWSYPITTFRKVKQ
ncbi:MAG TPA: hypothetical protein VFX59_01950, partial [Polyangiales bacterium]|nr:hypothetical protein [Polyangiales bacterium]